MQERYDPQAVEAKWQKIWADTRCFEAKTDPSQKKYFPLIEFPYPSGRGCTLAIPARLRRWT
jgi:leucyl-tRNA synthetase